MFFYCLLKSQIDQKISYKEIFFVCFYRESLAFATEPVFASLANIVKCYHNLPSNLPKELEEHKLYEVEIKYGLLQVKSFSND